MLVEGFGTTPQFVVLLMYAIVFSLTAYWLRAPF
jgi:hypothetical protein